MYIYVCIYIKRLILYIVQCIDNVVKNNLWGINFIAYLAPLQQDLLPPTNFSSILIPGFDNNAFYNKVNTKHGIT